jgi:hypothetical protein
MHEKAKSSRQKYGTKKGCAFPVASQSRSLPQITCIESLAPPSIFRAAAPVFYGCSTFKAIASVPL